MVHKQRWDEHYEPLLRANLAEHEQVAPCDERIASYDRIIARLLLLGGKHSPSYTTSQPTALLQQAVKTATVDIIEGLNHLASDEKAPEVVAPRVLEFW